MDLALPKIHNSILVLNLLRNTHNLSYIGTDYIKGYGV